RVSAVRLLAIDVGTQSARAIVFDAQGRLLVKAQTPIEPVYHSPQPGWAEQDPYVYWGAVVQSCQRLWPEGSGQPQEITGLSLTTQRATMICVDEGGEVLRPATVWLDQRRCDAPPDLGPLWNTAFRLAGATPLIRHMQADSDAN